MSAIGVGLVLSHEQLAPPDVVRLAVEAEAAGFDAVWSSDHFHPWQDNQGHGGNAWVTLGAIASRTRALAIGTGVTCPTYRLHPATVAQLSATLAHLAPGRVFLGLGTGEALNEIPPGGGWGPYGERADRLREAIALIRRLWTEEWVSSDGPWFPVTGANLYDRPPSPVPLLVAASGPRSARLAGELADGWITDAGTLLLARGRAARAAFRQGVEASGRRPSDLVVHVEQYVVVGQPSDDATLEAARLWQYLPVAAEVVAEPDPRRIQRYAEAHSSPERTLRHWIVSTDPAVHAARLHQLLEAGATGVFIHAPQRDTGRVLDLYQRHVLPAAGR